MADRILDQCQVCLHTVVTNAIQCDNCDKWTHRHCAGLSIKELTKFSLDCYSFLCSVCRSCFPFDSLNNNELYKELFLKINSCDLQYLNRDVILNTETLGYFQERCSYVTVDDFNTYYEEVPGLAILHLNVRSLVKNFNEL